MNYTVPFSDIPTGTSADAFKTLAAILAADTEGHRFKLRRLTVGFADDTPPDVNVALEIKRIADVSAGTAGTAVSTIAAANIPKKDVASLDSLMTAPLEYSTEPTVYEANPLWTDDLNAHGGIDKAWDFEEAPTFTRDSLCGLLAAPRTAAAVRVSGTLEFQVY